MIDGMAPPIILEATEFATLNTIPLDTLQSFVLLGTNIFHRHESHVLLPLNPKSYRLTERNELGFYNPLVLGQDIDYLLL